MIWGTQSSHPFSLSLQGHPTQVVLVGDGGEAFMKVVGAHSQSLALLAGMVMAILTKHHC